jgi:outer membrane protein assembly factor BamB
VRHHNQFRRKRGVFWFLKSCWKYCLTLLLFITGSALAADWPQYRGDNRDGVSAETGWLKTWPPTEVWRQTVGMAYSSVVVSEGRVYTMGWTTNTDFVYCFDAYDGTRLWSYSYRNGPMKGWGPNATPTVDGNKVYTYSHSGDLYCFNKATGAVLWNKVVDAGRHSEWGYAGSPLVEGNMIILNAGGGAAVDKNSGSNIWRNAGTGGFGSPKALTFNSKRIILMITISFPHGGKYDSSSCGVDAATGAFLPGWDFGGHYGEDPQFYGADKFYCGSTLYKIGTDGLTKVWGNDNMGTAYAACVVVGDYAYGYGNNGGALNCQSLSDGSIKWSQSGIKEGALMESDGKLVCLSDNGQLIVCKADPAAYNTEGRTPYQIKFEPYLGSSPSGCRACPALANGLLYCRDYGSYTQVNYVNFDQYANLVCLSFGASLKKQAANPHREKITSASGNWASTVDR